LADPKYCPCYIYLSYGLAFSETMGKGFYPEVLVLTLATLFSFGLHIVLINKQNVEKLFSLK
jgi:hypothetical protein